MTTVYGEGTARYGEGAAPQATNDAPKGLTRLTLLGPQRRVDLVLPSAEPLGVLVPQVMPLLGYGAVDSPHGYQMSLLDGRILNPADTLGSIGVPDGTLVRVDPLTAAPPAAVVHDVTDEVADDLERRAGRWGATARRWAGTVVCVVAVAWTAVLLPDHTRLAAPADVAAGLLVAVAGAVVTALGRRAGGPAATLAGAAAAAAGVSASPVDPPLRWAFWVALIAGVVFVLALAHGSMRAGAIGAGSLVAFLVLWLAVYLSGLPTVRDATVMAVVSTLALGLLPRLAVVASGLTRLDDARTDGAQVRRTTVTAAVDSAHRGLALAVAAVSASAALAGWFLGRGSGPWVAALACVTALVLLLRTRACPLTAEVASLIVAAGAIVVAVAGRLARSHPAYWWAAPAAAGAAAVVAYCAVWYEPPPHLRARARQLADRLEGIAVVALIPLAVGVFGVYARLLGAF